MNGLRRPTGWLATLLVAFSFASHQTGGSEPPVPVAAPADDVPAITVDAGERSAATVPDPDWLLPAPTLLHRADRGRSDLDLRDVIEEFHIEHIFDGLRLPVTIDGHEGEFLVDTAATGCILDRSLESLLWKTGDSFRINDRQGFDEYTLPPTYLGKSRIPVNVPVLCADLRPFKTSSRDPLLGILGMSFLKDRVVRIDFDSGTLAILRRHHGAAAKSLKLSYNDGGIPVVDLNVGTNRTISFMLDTGFTRRTYSGWLDTATFEELLREKQLTSTGKRVIQVNFLGRMSSRAARLVGDLRLGKFSHAGLDFLEGPVTVLSLGYLSRYVVVIDFRNGRLYLDEGNRFEESPAVDLCGSSVVRIGGKTIVQDIDANSPAAWWGLRDGDRLLCVDGETCSEMSMPELQDRLLRKGGRMRLVVQSEGEPRLLECHFPDWGGFGARLRAVVTADSCPADEVQEDANAIQQSERPTCPHK